MLCCACVLICSSQFKTEASPEWDAFRLIDAGIFPQPLSSRQFGQICNN